MGVQNLWVLLAPVGRQIEIESLAGQVLAVDASIWLTQFVKAMRDDEGNMIRNAHLMGTLHRVAKLLYYGIRPVFVFDGQTPEIKKRTTARRKKRQEQQSANFRHTAQRILLNKLKQARQEMKKRGGAPAPAVAPGFTLPKDSSATIGKEKTRTAQPEAKTVEQESIEKGEADDIEKNSTQTVWVTADKDEEQLTIDDIEMDSSSLSKIDLHAVFSLPPHLQKDMIHKIQRDRRQNVRNQFIPLAGNPEKYSHTQISAFLKTSALNRRIEAAKRQKREEEINHEGGVGQGHRIDSNCDRFYIYENSAKRKVEKDEDRDDVMAETEQASAIEAMQPNQKSDKVFESIEKPPLIELPTAKDWSSPKASAADIATAWVARHQVRVKQEPVLEIEKLRQARIKADKQIFPIEPFESSDTKLLSQHDLCISTKLRDLIDPNAMVHSQKVLPASELTSAPVVSDGDESDDVQWEEVAAPTTEQPLINSLQSGSVEQKVPGQFLKAVVTTSNSPDLSTKSLNHANVQNSGSDEEVEWENVPRASVDGAATSTSGLEKSVYKEKCDSSNPLVNTPVEELLNLQDKEENELFLTLKSEMEDGKAHEDLHLLKADALQSAMVTASNLTQWAAGAVRRALQAHSLQQSGNVERDASRNQLADDRLDFQCQPTEGTAKAPLKILDEEDGPKLDSTERKTSAEASVVKDESDDTQNDDVAQGEMVDSYEQLQAALAASVEGEREEENAGNSRARYLQYAQSSSTPQSNDTNEPEMDAKALQMEQLELKKLRNRQLRDTEGVTDDMVAEVMALLRLFGVPFLVSPMEAEAQCAALEQLGLVDGVITDDSDIFPFGGQRVYKNIFHHQKFVEAFSASDIKRELGFSRDQIIALALLLGSDYTDGVRGIGIVNATEIAAAYPGIEGLRDFKEWVCDFDVSEEAQRVALAGSKKKKRKATKNEVKNEMEQDSDDTEEETARTRFQRAHATARRKWELGDEFPSKQVVQAYMAPQVDRSEERFSWSAPDVAALHNYCANAFGWDQQKSDGVLKPLEEKTQAALASGGRHIQTRLDRFFTSYKDQVHYAQIKSKRLRSAVLQGNKDSNKSKKSRK